CPAVSGVTTVPGLSESGRRLKAGSTSKRSSLKIRWAGRVRRLVAAPPTICPVAVTIVPEVSVVVVVRFEGAPPVRRSARIVSSGSGGAGEEEGWMRGHVPTRLTTKSETLDSPPGRVVMIRAEPPLFAEGTGPAFTSDR